MVSRREFVSNLGKGVLAATLPLSPTLSFSKPADSFDLVIVGGTPAGVAMAITAARYGLSVLIVNHNEHMGGFLTSGASVWDTLYEGKRSPVYNDLRQRIFDHYKTTYGENSPQYRNSLPGETGHTNGRFEARVAESIIDRMLDEVEANVQIRKGFIPRSAQVVDQSIRSVTFTTKEGKSPFTVEARIFADCTYEGDLLPVVGAPYTVGRESRNEYNEPHAGKLYMCNLEQIHYRKPIDLRHFGTFQALVFPESTGEGDALVQAFNMRMVLSSDPANQRKPVPSAGYDPDYLRTLEYHSVIEPLPNNKLGWNRPQIVGPHNAYVEGDWKTRQEVIELHCRLAMDFLYFLQNDPSVKPEVQQTFQKFGLALDEFTDNGNFPYEIYVREARRLRGDYVVSQSDLMNVAGLERPPIQSDSVAMTDWYMDSHACGLDTVKGSMMEGKMMLHYDTYPGQVPFRSLTTSQLGNLLVPVCLSCTHVAWGALRLEPTWMNIAESAGVAAALAVRQKKNPSQLNTEKLLLEIADRRIATTLYNDLDITAKAAWIPAVQYFGNKGFFPSYKLRIDEPLSEATATLWCQAVNDLIQDKLDANATVKAVWQAPANQAITSGDFEKIFNKMVKQNTAGKLECPNTASLTRGQAVSSLYDWCKEHYS